MAQICIQIPPLDEAQTIELEVKVNGEKRLMHYRVESFDWTAGGQDLRGRIRRLKAMIAAYDPGWELVQIGQPSEHLIPVMFRQRALAELPSEN